MEDLGEDFIDKDVVITKKSKSSKNELIKQINNKFIFTKYTAEGWIEALLNFINEESWNEETNQPTDFYNKNYKLDEIETKKEKYVTIELRGKFDLDIILNDSKPSKSYNIFNLVSDGVEFFGTGIISNVIQDITGTLNNEENMSKNLLRQDYFILKKTQELNKNGLFINLDEKRFEFINDLLDNYSDNLYLNAVSCIKCIEELTFDPGFLKSLRESYNYNSRVNGGLGSGVISLRELYDFIDNSNIDYIDNQKLFANIEELFDLGELGGGACPTIYDGSECNRDGTDFSKNRVDTMEKIENTDFKKICYSICY